MLLFLGAGATGSDDDLSSLAVDVEGQMARFVAKTLRVCGRLVVLTHSVADLEI